MLLNFVPERPNPSQQELPLTFAEEEVLVMAMMMMMVVVVVVVVMMVSEHLPARVAVI